MDLRGAGMTDTEAAAMADWLVELGYPFDVSVDVPIPEFMREPLVEAWFRHDGIPGEDIDLWRKSCAEEGMWHLDRGHSGGHKEAAG